VYLSVALEEYEKDGDTEAFLLALRDVTEAQGGIAKLAERTKLNRQNLYKALSDKGNPRLETVGAILHGLGFRLSVEPIRASE
jgi:probable addiction module antidote protein